MNLRNCTDPHSSRAALILPVKIIVVHHCSLKTIGLPDAQLNGTTLSHAFETMKELGTEGCRPYHALICQDGNVDQCISLHRRGAHALAFNCNTLAVCTAGELGLTIPQRQALIDVLADWLELCEGTPVSGHTALGADATRLGHPICPHPTTDVAQLTKAALNQIMKPVCGTPYDVRVQHAQQKGWIFA